MITVSNVFNRIPTLFADLAKLLTGDIDCSALTLSNYSKDNSPYLVLPQAVIYPKNVTDIKHTLAFAREYTMPVTVRGKGTGSTGGALGEGIILDLTRYFSQIRNINMMENTITVDAGVTVSSLLEKLHTWHYDIPILSTNDTHTTIGALIATKNTQSSSFRHGTIREWIEGLTVVVDTGEEHILQDGITPSGRLLGIYQEIFPFMTQEHPTIRASKPLTHDDATGYNLWSTSIGPRQLIDQLTGSEGTLGIITSVTFRITPYKEHYVTTCIPIKNSSLLAPCIDIAKHHSADEIFMYDQAFMQLADRYQPTVVPLFIDTPYVLLVTHRAHDKEKLHHTIHTFRRALPIDEYELKTLVDHETVARISDQNFLKLLGEYYTQNVLVPNEIANGIIVTIHQLPSLLRELESYLDQLGRLYMITGFAGSGHISVTAYFDPKSKNYANDLIGYAKEITSIVTSYNGGISAIHGEGLARAPFIQNIYSTHMLEVFRSIKKIWDPLHILNPGKKLDVQTSYLVTHTRTDTKRVT